MALTTDGRCTPRPPVPLFDVAAWLGLRRVSYDRPGYGGCSPHPARDVASAAADAAAVADVLGIGRFAVFGHSGGAPHARRRRVAAATGALGARQGHHQVGEAVPDRDHRAGAVPQRVVAVGGDQHQPDPVPGLEHVVLRL